MRSWVAAVVLGALVCAAATGSAWGREATDRTTGLRFDPPLSMIAESPTDPNVLYLATARGRIYASRDGGQSWEETAVLTARGRFFGAIREGGDDEETPETIGERLAFVPHFGHIALGLDPDVTADRPNQVVASPNRWVRRKIDRLIDRYEGPVGAAAEAGGPDLGVGLRDGAPRLAYQVREISGWGVGVNIKQTLANKGSGGTWINWIDVDPRDPDTVFAATDDGLRRSTDGGYSWPVVLSGVDQAARTIVVVRRDPHDDNRLLVGTEQGLHISRDRGRTFERFINPLVTSSDVRWIEFHPTQPDTWLIGVDWGLLRTTDGGRDFDIIHRSTWPALSHVTYAVYDPRAPTRILAGTRDGLLMSEDGGATFARAGGLQFVAQEIIGLSAGPAAGHFLAATERDLWETLDGGKSWRIAYFGAIEWKTMFAAFSRHGRGDIWVITEAEVLQLRAATAQAVAPRVLAAFRQLVAEEPRLEEAVDRALGRAGARISDVVAARQRSRWAGVLPTVEATYYRYAFDAFDVRTTAFISRLVDADIQADGRNVRPFWAVMGYWDLGSLIHRSAESPINRVGGVNAKLEWRVRSTVINLYQERRRLQLERLLSRTPDPRAALLRALRLEELTAHLNALAGPLFEPMDAL